MLKKVVHSLGLVENTKKDSKKKNKAKGSKASSEFSSRSKDFVVKIKHVGGQKELYKHPVLASKLMTKHHGMCVARPDVFKDPHHSVLDREELLLPGHKYILIPFKEVDKLKRKHAVHSKTKGPNGVVVANEMLNTKARSPSGHKSKENGKVPNGVARQETHDEITRSPSGDSHKENGKMGEPNGVERQEMLETEEENGLVEEMEDTKVDESLGGGGEEQSLFHSARDFYVPKEKRTRRKGIKGKKPFVAPLPKGRPYRSLGWQPSLPTVKELSP